MNLSLTPGNTSDVTQVKKLSESLIRAVHESAKRHERENIVTLTAFLLTQKAVD